MANDTPSRGIYKCQVHGCFVHQLNGVVLPWALCPAECMTLDIGSNQMVSVPCGLRSPLANQNDINTDQKFEAMDDKTWEEFKQTIHKLRQGAAEGQQMYGRRWQAAGAGTDWKQLAASSAEEVIKQQEAEDKKVAREMWEVIERKKMKLAMAEAGIEI